MAVTCITCNITYAINIFFCKICTRPIPNEELHLAAEAPLLTLSDLSYMPIHLRAWGRNCAIFKNKHSSQMNLDFPKHLKEIMKLLYYYFNVYKGNYICFDIEVDMYFIDKNGTGFLDTYSHIQKTGKPFKFHRYGRLSDLVKIIKIFKRKICRKISNHRVFDGNELCRIRDITIIIVKDNKK